MMARKVVNSQLSSAQLLALNEVTDYVQVNLFIMHNSLLTVATVSSCHPTPTKDSLTPEGKGVICYIAGQSLYNVQKSYKKEQTLLLRNNISRKESDRLSILVNIIQVLFKHRVPAISLNSDSFFQIHLRLHRRGTAGLVV